MAIRIFCHQSDPDPGHREKCRDYLRLRCRPAAEALIRQQDAKGLQILLTEGLIPPADKERLLKLALSSKSTDCLAALLKTDKEGDMPFPKSSFEKQILELSGRFFDRYYPSLAGIFHLLSVKEEEKAAPLGSDGFGLYVNTSWLKENFVRDSKSLKRDLAHTLMHQTLLHSCQAAMAGSRDSYVFDACCDCIAEWTLDVKLGYERELSDELKDKRQRVYKIIEKEGFLTAAHLYEGLKSAGKINALLLKELFAADDHSFWYGKRRSAAEWMRQIRKMKFQSGGGEDMAGGSFLGKGGSGTTVYKEPEASEYAYKEFLENFMVNGEEMVLDLENFDPVWYHYSRTHYESAVFLEPAETSEVRRLEELVIAIDTSGSCSGDIVQQFLSETFSILEKKEHFFRKMRIHILQCDSMIQDYRLIEDEEDYKAYKEHLKIKGFGYTDFQPVFKWVEDMRAKGEIRDLKGLIYFTDGAGVYPKKAPDYETAFVFLNDKFKKGETPPWARQLNLNMERDFRTLFDDEREGRIGNGWEK